MSLQRSKGQMTTKGIHVLDGRTEKSALAQLRCVAGNRGGIQARPSYRHRGKHFTKKTN